MRIEFDLHHTCRFNLFECYSLDSQKCIKTVLWTQIDQSVFNDYENAYFWKCILVDRVSVTPAFHNVTYLKQQLLAFLINRYKIKFKNREKEDPQWTYHFTTTKDSFLGSISAMKSSMGGNCSTSLAFIARWTDDFTWLTPETASPAWNLVDKKKHVKEIYHKEENVFHETNSNIVLSNEISLKAIVREIGLNQFKHTTTRQQNILDGTYQVRVNFYKYSDP